MKIAIFGSSGQVATELRRRTPVGVSLITVGRDTVDFRNPEEVFAAACDMDVDAIINAAAYTAVDKAEEEPELANAVNGASVGELARACSKTSVPLVHISTDYVFDGSGQSPWTPSDETNPLSVYGSSKQMGEQLIAEREVTHAILRTSWVFSAHGNNFVKTMLRLGAEREALSIVADQIGGPTPAAAIADACFAVAQGLSSGRSSGIYHFAGSPDTSWADFAREIFRQSRQTVQVTDIETKNYPTPARRPLNSRLDCESLNTEFGVERPDWRVSLSAVLKELGYQ